MKKKQNSAFSLLELIVASTVIGIIMLGVISSNVSLQKGSKDFTSSYFVAQSTQNVLNHILTSASLAVGSVDPLDWGIKETNNNQTFCIRQNIGGTAWPGLYVLPPSNNAPDLNYRWVCYNWIPTAPTPPSNVYNIYWCQFPTTRTGVIPTNASLAGCTTNLLGKIRSFTADYNVDANARKSLFDVTIINSLDPSCPASNPCGTARNPSVTKSGSVSPAGQSAG